MDRTSEAILKTEDLELRVGKLERMAAESDGSGGGGNSGGSTPILFLEAPKIYIGTSSFGNIKTTGKALAIVTFSGDSTTLRFNGKTIVTGTSPLVATISGQGKLDLSNNRNGSVAVLIGNCTKV